MLSYLPAMLWETLYYPQPNSLLFCNELSISQTQIAINISNTTQYLES